jgi:hypothetical protein
MIERKIGEVFEHEGKLYQCLEHKNKTCNGECNFLNLDIQCKYMKCEDWDRSDEKSVRYKEIKFSTEYSIDKLEEKKEKINNQIKELNETLNWFESRICEEKEYLKIIKQGVNNDD